MCVIRKGRMTCQFCFQEHRASVDKRTKLHVYIHMSHLRLFWWLCVLGGGAGVPGWADLTCTPIPRWAYSPPPPPTVNSPLAPGTKLVFSSYPGTLFSCDDFYIVGSGLVSVPLVSPFSPGLPIPSPCRGSTLSAPRSPPQRSVAGLGARLRFCSCVFSTRRPSLHRDLAVSCAASPLAFRTLPLARPGFLNKCCFQCVVFDRFSWPGSRLV